MQTLEKNYLNLISLQGNQHPIINPLHPSKGAGHHSEAVQWEGSLMQLCLNRKR